jgi:NAD(P)H-dependent FMN reductase
MSDAPVRVLVVAGSLRRPSFTRAVCDATADALAAAGAVVDRWDVADPLLALADPAFHRDPRRHPDPDILSRLDRLAPELVALTEAIRPARHRLLARYA